MNLVELFIRAEIMVAQILDKKQHPEITGGEDLVKLRKNLKKKLEFKKVWFMQRFADLYEKYEDVFIDLEFTNESADAIYKECKAGYKQKDPRCMQFYDFINRIYIDEITPKEIVYFV